MKLIAVIATAIFLAISGVATKILYDNSQAHRKEKAEKVAQVESYRAAIKAALTTRAASEEGSSVEVYQKIRLIDVSQCPPEFKTAWFDYLWVMGTTPNLSSTDVHNLRYDALRACQRIAVQYGVWEPAAVPVF